MVGAAVEATAARERGGVGVGGVGLAGSPAGIAPGLQGDDNNAFVKSNFKKKKRCIRLNCWGYYQEFGEEVG